MQDKITAALTKLGPVSPGELADHLSVGSSKLGYHIKVMLDAGTLKASGSTGNRRIALPDQKLDPASTPPQRRKKATKAKAKPKRAAPKARAPQPAAAPAGDFLTAITADCRLVLFNPGSAKPLVLTEDQTERVAELMYAHFEE